MAASSIPHSPALFPGCWGVDWLDAIRDATTARCSMSQKNFVSPRPGFNETGAGLRRTTQSSVLGCQSGPTVAGESFVAGHSSFICSGVRARRYAGLGRGSAAQGAAGVTAPRESRGILRQILFRLITPDVRFLTSWLVHCCGYPPRGRYSSFSVRGRCASSSADALGSIAAIAF
jgi:hypothetical protein